MAVSRKSSRPTYLWHHDIHTRIGNEQLIFVLAGFDPVYKRQRVLEETKRVLSDLNIGSYSLWELIGEHDLMIQAWLPKGVRPDEFVSRLGDSATVGVGIDTLTMAVDSLVSHWMWNDVNLEHVESEINPGDYSHLNEAWVPATRIARYRDAGFIHPVLRAKAPELFIRITNPHRTTNSAIESQILETARELVAGDTITNGVIMKVSGGASYLLTGRLPLKNFEAIAEVIQAKFAKSGLLEMLRCRTVTNMSALYAPLETVEQLLPIATGDATQKPSNRDLEQWLKESESDDLEFKSSSFTDIDYAIGRRDKSRTRTDQVREIAKAVVGMLNASGGTAIIGVAELDKYSIEDLLRVCPDGQAVGHRFVIGVDSEFPSSGGWDAYQRNLASSLRRIIEGEIDGWVKYHEVQFRSRTLCVIRIRRPSAWYYVKETNKSGVSSTEFYGRTGGETRPLRGQRMDQFKEANPRTTRSD